LVELKNINLLRTNRSYSADSLKSVITEMVANPLMHLIQSRQTDSILKNVNMIFDKGDKVAIFGKNGSGKTTLCKIIAGQITPSSGLLKNTLKSTYASQLENCLFNELTGLENLKFLISHFYSDLSTTEQNHILNESIQLAELHESIHFLSETYSLGMKSRLCWAVVFARSRELLILDEMSSHVDEFFKENLGHKLEYSMENAKIFIYVSHHIDVLTEKCNRGIVIDNSEIIFDGNLQKAIACYRMLSTTNV
jgi:ABC-type polysaccharide/polyol phosphate transport system ATPase subunit